MASPGVKTVERDASQNVRALGESSGGFVGTFNWGRIDEYVQISNEDDLLQYFGKPDDINYVDWFSAANFLQYTGNLTVKRIASATAMNASSGTAGVLIKNQNAYDILESTLTDTFYAKYAGDLGNSISVHVADSSTFETWKYKGEFDTAPASSEYSEVYHADADDEIHVIVIDTLGKIKGIPNGVLEKFPYLSKAKDGRDTNNQTSYYKNVINRKSPYIYVGADIGADYVVDIASTHINFGKGYDTVLPFAKLSAPIVVDLKGGVNGGIAGKAEYVSGVKALANIDDESVSVIFVGDCGGDTNHADVVNALGGEVKKIQKSVGFFSPKVSDVVAVADEQAAFDNIMTTYSTITEKHSYMSMSSGVKMIYDKYNDVYRWIPTNSDEAGVWARTHNNEGKWVSAAGYNKGVYSNAVGLAFNPKKEHRDALYAKNINCVIQENGAGILLFGDKTLQGKNSTFSFLTTRFLFIELRNIIGEASKYVLFEDNNDYTRSQFRDLVIPTLRDIKGKRGIHNFSVVCDESNNTDKAIQNGEFIGDIYIKPNYSIQNVLLTFTSVNRTLSFDEVVV